MFELVASGGESRQVAGASAWVKESGYAIGVALIGVLAFLLAANAASWTGFNPDESRWLSRAHYLADLADPFGPTWADQYMTRGQPPLGSYAMGLGLLLQGRDLETNPPWDFSVTWEENFAIGNKPSDADLLAGRRTSAALAGLTAMTLIALARVFVPPMWALVAGLVFAMHPFGIYIGSIAMSDALFGLLIALAALAAARFARQPGWGRALLLGALLGLGGATKLSPLAVAAALAGAAALCAMYGQVYGRLAMPPRRLAGYGIALLLSAMATFVIVYPYLWPSPVERTHHLFAFRVEEMAAQASDWPVMAVPTRLEAIRRVGVNFSERFSLAGQLGSWLGWPEVPLLLRQVELGLAIIGIMGMALLAVRAGPLSPHMLVIAVLCGQAIVTILGMRSEFDRYHLPMALLGAVAIAVALYRLSRLWVLLVRGRINVLRESRAL